MHERRYVARGGPTASADLDAWDTAHTRDLEDATRAKAGHRLRPVRERLGDRKLQSLARTDIDGLVSWMQTQGRKRGGRPGTGLSARTIADTLAIFRLAVDDALDERLIA
ncbi:MAG: hypothetical protein M0030_09395 [Actinomycetota bacterium]|nr:hypothetical protein [Actinomycetota bacterium]